MAVRERNGSRIGQPQGAVSLRETPFASNSIIWLPSNPSADLGTRGNVPALVGNNVLRTGQDGAEVYHPSTVGSDALVWAAPSGADDGFALLIRFKLDTSSQTTIFNSANEVTTSGAAQLRTSSATLQYTSRDSAVRFSSSGVPLVVGRWHTVALRVGLFPKATAGRLSGRMWLDGVYVGAWNTASPDGFTLGDFAVACGRYSTDSAQARAHSVSLAAFAFDSASDEELRAASENPYGYLFGDRRIWVPVAAGGTSYTDSLSDSAASTDSASTALVALQSESDSAAATDAASTALQAVDALADAGASTDAATSTHSAVSALADSAAATDSASSAHAAVNALADSAAATDSATGDIGAQSYTESLSDAAAASDAIAHAASLSDALADSAAATDAFTLAGAVYTESLTDTAAAADSIGSAAVMLESCADLLAGSDIVVGEGGSENAPDVLGSLVAADRRTQKARRVNVQTSRRRNIQTVSRGN